MGVSGFVRAGSIGGAVAVVVAASLVFGGCSSAAETGHVPDAQPCADTPSTTTTSMAPGGPRQVALTAALDSAPDVAAALRDGRARLVELVGWSEEDRSVGIAASYEFVRPVDLPTAYGKPHLLFDGPEDHDEIEYDDDGLPVMVPLQEASGWRGAHSAVLLVATVGSRAPRVHQVRPGYEVSCVPPAPPGMPAPPTRPS
ncbi:MAG: hypothetical protein JWM89_2953 [Acidimicrobiales bacterium]|nr:hypothetical protein [Acidimicrobiales bacterium]